MSFRIIPAKLSLALAAALLAGSCLSPAAAQNGVAPIPWQSGVTFSRTSVDDDVRSVLRAILAAQGLSVIFQTGVEGRLSFNFREVPLETAFNQVLGEGGLHARFNSATKTVTITSGAETGGGGMRFITLQALQWPSLRQMLTSFGLGTDGISFDPETSVLAVTGDPARVAQIEDLVKTLEKHYDSRRDQALTDGEHAAQAQRSDLERRMYQDALNMQTKVFRLRFADVGPTSRNFHGRTITIPGVLETLQAMLGSPTGGAPFTTQSAASPVFRPSVGPRTSLPGAPPVLSQAQGGPAENRADLVGRPNLSVDQRTNSVIVRGSPSAIAAVADVLRQIDQPVKMVEIEVIIATAEVGVINQLGISYRGLFRNGVGVDTGTSLGQLSNLPGYNALTLLPTAAAGAAVASFVVNNGGGTSLTAQLQALAEHNKARVLSAPHLVTLDNITARITRAEDIYVPVDTGGLNGQGLSQIQTGLTLEITPSIVPPASGGGNDKLVRLTLNATNSAPGSGTGNHINVTSQEVQTDVLVPDGGTFVIGGLFDDSRLKSRSGIPVLKDIPLLGGLFRTDNEQQSLGQTIFFITPRVIEQQELVSREIALDSAVGPGTSGYMDQQRQRLATTSAKINGSTATASAFLEEDE
ncbi:MAG: secretin N-terminal domain-containing protein [Janthinobacterium lividum]